MHDLLNRPLSEIELPPQLHARCMQGVRSAQQNKETTMINTTETRKTVRFSAVKRIAAAAAAVAVCTVMLGGTALADSLAGFFADVTRWDGAVTGTEYHAAAQELAVSAQTPVAEGDALLLPVTVAFEDPGAAPFAYLEELTVEEFALQNAAGEEISAQTGCIPGTIENGTVRMMLYLPSGLPDGQYTLVVRGFSGTAKAEQPLPIFGQWSCVFDLP